MEGEGLRHSYLSFLIMIFRGERRGDCSKYVLQVGKKEGKSAEDMTPRIIYASRTHSQISQVWKSPPLD